MKKYTLFFAVTAGVFYACKSNDNLPVSNTNNRVMPFNYLGSTIGQIHNLALNYAFSNVNKYGTDIIDTLVLDSLWTFANNFLIDSVPWSSSVVLSFSHEVDSAFNAVHWYDSVRNDFGTTDFIDAYYLDTISSNVGISSLDAYFLNRIGNAILIASDSNQLDDSLTNIGNAIGSVSTWPSPVSNAAMSTISIAQNSLIFWTQQCPSWITSSRMLKNNPSIQGIRWDEVKATLGADARGAATGALIGIFFGDPLAGAGIGAVRASVFAPTPLH